MENEQIFCDKCGKLLFDERQGVEEIRHQAVVQLNYSAIGEWGYAEEAVERKSQTGYCTDCFREIWVQVEALAKTIDREVRPIRTYRSAGKFYETVKKVWHTVKPC